MTDDELLSALRRAVASAGGNGLALDQLEAVFVQAVPSLATAPDRRAVLRDALDVLVAQGVIRYPAARGSWDRAGEPALPSWIRPPLGALGGGTRRSDSGRLPGALRAELSSARALEPLSATELDTLVAINAWLVDRSSHTNRLVVPHRERSLEIFGDEKRLDALRSTRLFASGTVSFELLSCAWVPPQLPWRRVGTGTVALVLENAATFHSVAFVLEQHPGDVGIVAAGGGNAFTQSVEGLSDPAVGPVTELRYFGDLDVTGLEIPQRAARRAAAVGLPTPTPAGGLYRLLLDCGTLQRASRVPSVESCVQTTRWLGADLAMAAMAILVGGHRLAQEAVGMELLLDHLDALAR